MKITKEQFEELSSAYAVGALNREEEKIIFEMLDEKNEEYERIFSESVRASFLLNQSVIRAVPSLSTKIELLQKIESHRISNESSFGKFADAVVVFLGLNNPKFALMISSLLLIIVVEVSTVAYVFYHKEATQDKALVLGEQQLNAQHGELLALRSETQYYRSVLDILRSSATRTIVLENTSSVPPFKGKIILEKNTHAAVFFADTLPGENTETAYQIWIIDQRNGNTLVGSFENSHYIQHTYLINDCTLPSSPTGLTFGISGGIGDSLESPGQLFVLGTVGH